MILYFFPDINLWGIFFVTLAISFIAFEAGVFLGKRHRQYSEDEDRSPIGSIVAAGLGLLAFLLAFTFGIEATKFDERRSLVVEEANAIGTTYLRAEYLEEPYKTEIQKLLTEYVDVRLNAIKNNQISEALKKSDKLQDLLWSQAVSIAKKHPDSITAGLFIESLNQVIDLHAKRVHLGVHFKMPAIIWDVLYFVMILAIGSLGYQFGLTKTRYRGITLLLIMTFSIVISLIQDLDRPQEGFLRVPQQSLIELQNKFNSKKM